MSKYKYGHKKSVLKEKHAGKIVPSLQNLPIDTEVVLFQKGTEHPKEPYHNDDGWWEYGEVFWDSNENRKRVTTWDSYCDQDAWEMYIDKRTKGYHELVKKLKL